MGGRVARSLLFFGGRRRVWYNEEEGGLYDMRIFLNLCIGLHTRVSIFDTKRLTAQSQLKREVIIN
jgi:hypothetical protein